MGQPARQGVEERRKCLRLNPSPEVWRWPSRTRLWECSVTGRISVFFSSSSSGDSIQVQLKWNKSVTRTCWAGGGTVGGVSALRSWGAHDRCLLVPTPALCGGGGGPGQPGERGGRSPPAGRGGTWRGCGSSRREKRLGWGADRGDGNPGDRKWAGLHFIFLLTLFGGFWNPSAFIGDVSEFGCLTFLRPLLRKRSSFLALPWLAFKTGDTLLLGLEGHKTWARPEEEAAENLLQCFVLLISDYCRSPLHRKILPLNFSGKY